MGTESALTETTVQVTITKAVWERIAVVEPGPEEAGLEVYQEAVSWLAGFLLGSVRAAVCEDQR